MGKRNSSKKKEPGGGKRSNSAPLIMVGAVLAVLAVVYFATKPPTASELDAVHERHIGARLETRPVLTPALFTGKAALAYRYAAEIPDAIDNQFCYCYCKKNHGHKTLLTCFTNEHGSKCDTCIEEVIHAYELHKQGKSMDEIVTAVDKKFYRPYKS